ncbi:MerR family transcriptional regulator [Micromonospora sp. NBC_01813]|uniref:MerR family transcriptional regulator n=1 Tax=Micromonospora sp. NBC_01813 TaxID=2975988 RepID=UPI002DD8F2BB|nr:MerR family transcriptional regulator [Micromonospora sp. NBC_01813]WSA09188.1 MerR family transcriptional regulator [Micromonospora sp. NBC_01813]
MRISELSQHSGLPIATIKFYLREGLLPPGKRTGRNQADYGKEHLSRLYLITTLTVVGRLPLSAVREIVAAIDDRGMQLDGLCRVINEALVPVDREDEAGPIGTAARKQVDDFVDSLNWSVDPGAPSRSTLTQVLTALRLLGWNDGVEVFTPYQEAAEIIASRELEKIPTDANEEEAAVMLVARTVLFEVAWCALRGMAHEHILTTRLANAREEDDNQ